MFPQLKSRQIGFKVIEKIKTMNLLLLMGACSVVAIIMTMGRGAALEQMGAAVSKPRSRRPG